MSLKNVKTLGSIRTRLMFFYTTAVFFVLMILACFLYWMAITILYKADYEFLSDEVDTIQYVLDDNKIDWPALNQEVIGIPMQKSKSIYRYYIRVYDGKKKLIIQTPGMENIIVDEKTLHPLTESLGKKHYFWYETKNNKNFLLIESPLILGTKKIPGRILIALDTSYQHGIIKDRKELVAVLLVTTLLALFMGFLITNRGMLSLTLLTETVQKTTATSLDKRIDVKRWPKELKNLAVAFNQMLDRIEHSFNKLKQFSADLSHELRTPITNLIGQTEVSLAYAKSIPEYQQTMESNLEELHRLSALTDNMLFLARTENPHLVLKKELLQAEKEISLVCDFYQLVADEKNVTLQCEGTATVLANPDMFRRVISNILSNSIKHTQVGGKIVFHVNQPRENRAEIIIIDNGEGISAESLPYLFDRFYRVESSRPQHAGTGLGLAIVKSIIELHNGTIAITSELGKGTIITIYLPT